MTVPTTRRGVRRPHPLVALERAGRDEVVAHVAIVTIPTSFRRGPGPAVTQLVRVHALDGLWHEAVAPM